MKKAAAGRPGVRVVPLLVGAAIAGILGGVVMAFGRGGPIDEGAMEQRSQELADEVIPGPGALTASYDPMEPDPDTLRGVPPYPSILGPPRKIHRSLPGSGEVNAVSWFQTDDSVDRVLSFYENAYAAAGFNYNSHRYSKDRGYVGWFERSLNADGGAGSFGEGVQHLIFATREGPVTTVLLGANEPYRMLQRVNRLPGGVSIPDGSRPQVITLGEPGAEFFSIFAAYAELSADELGSELLARMKERGWVVQESLVSETGQRTVVAGLEDFVQVAVVDGVGSGSQLLITLEKRPAQKRGQGQ